MRHTVSFQGPFGASFSIPTECEPACEECLDAAGRPLLVTSRPQRTGLVRSFVALRMHGPGKRTHWCRQPQEFFSGLWTVAVCGPVRAGEAQEDAVWRMLNADPYWQGLLAFARTPPTLRPLLVLSPKLSAGLFPPAAHGKVRTTIFSGRIMTLPADFLNAGALRRHPAHIWLDPEELQAFTTLYADQLSPLATRVAESSANPEG